MCGAAALHSGLEDEVEGLSPRVWGSRPAPPVAVSLPGSIPTCVGQPAVQIALPYLLQVYPHVCGAAVDYRNLLGVTAGLSPRVWGSRVD